MSRPNDRVLDEVRVLSLGDVAKLQQPYALEAYSALDDHPYLLIDLDAAGSRLQSGSENGLESDFKDGLEGGLESELEATQLRNVVDILAQFSCPLIGFGLKKQTRLASVYDVLDVHLERYQDTLALIKNIQRYPIASMSLVQLLRAQQRMRSADALVAESFAYGMLQGGLEYRSAIKDYKKRKGVAVADKNAKGLADSAPDRAQKVADSTPTTDNVEALTASAVLLARKTSSSGVSILTITLNQAEGRNAYSSQMRDELYQALQFLQVDKSIDRALWFAQGPCFSTGGALEEFEQVSDTATAHAIRSSRNVAQLLLHCAPRLQCHIQSACIGSGLELSAFAGRIIARKNAFFQLPEISLGLIPGAGGTVSIARRIGRQKCAYLLLSGKKISAKKALQWGLIDQIVDQFEEV